MKENNILIALINSTLIIEPNRHSDTFIIAFTFSPNKKLGIL